MKIYLYLSCLLLGACTSMPKAIQNMDVMDITYSQASQNIESHRNVPVRWGGIIIDVENEEDFSLVQVLFYPLNYSGRPQLNDPHGGRFVIKSTEFLDPVVYAKDKEISVVGTLDGDIQRTVGKKVIRVPLIQSMAVHLWPKRQNNYYGYGGYGPYHYGYYSYPFIRGGYYYPYRY
jgi:outer membrane lipoprotein